MSTVRHDQTGYDGSSRSTRATVAEQEGKLPLTRLCRTYGFAPARVKAFVDPCEWHHSSKYANATDYYDPRDALRYRRYITVRRPSPEQLAARETILAEAINRAQESGSLLHYDVTPYEKRYGVSPQSVLLVGKKLRRM